ncbi:adenylate/guanylate cyclase domain-containing protein [Tumidithrix elongata]
MLVFTAPQTDGKLHLRGELYPVAIHDTYAIDLTLRYDEDGAVPLTYDRLIDLNPKGIRASLGQTLFVMLKLADSVASPSEVARVALQFLLGRNDLQEVARGSLLGSPIVEFEYGVEPAEHALVWLDGNSRTTEAEQEGAYYVPLFNLLCYRSKILYVYEQSRWCFEQLQVMGGNMRQKGQTLAAWSSSDADKQKFMREWLDEIPTQAIAYEAYLRDMESHLIASEINIKNYTLWLKRLRKHCFIEDDLGFLEIFGDVCDSQQQQIQIDLQLAASMPAAFASTVPILRQSLESQVADGSSDRNILSAVNNNGKVLAAILFTDVVGYSARMDRDEERTIELVDRDFALMHDIFEREGGVLVNTMGDGLMIRFDRVSQAVDCAIAMQASLVSAAKELPTDDVLQHRIGIHVGEVRIRGKNTLGRDVNIAARLEGKAAPGSICISQAVYEAVKDRLPDGVLVERLGQVALKNMGYIEAYHLTLSR